MDSRLQPKVQLQTSRKASSIAGRKPGRTPDTAHKPRTAAPLSASTIPSGLYYDAARPGVNLGMVTLTDGEPI